MLFHYGVVLVPVPLSVLLPEVSGMTGGVLEPVSGVDEPVPPSLGGGSGVGVGAGAGAGGVAPPP